MGEQPLYPHVPKGKQVQFPHTAKKTAVAGELPPGTSVRLKSGTEGWIRGTIVEYFDIYLMPPLGAIYGGGMAPGYKVHILEGKHKGETIRVPTNYVQRA